MIFSVCMHGLLLLALVGGLAFATIQIPPVTEKILSLRLDPAPSGEPSKAPTPRIPQSEMPRTQPPSPPQPVTPVNPPAPQISEPPDPPKQPAPAPTQPRVETRVEPRVEPDNPQPRVKAKGPKVDPSSSKAPSTSAPAKKSNISTKVVERPGTSAPANSSPRSQPRPSKTIHSEPGAINQLREQMSDSVGPLEFKPGTSNYNNFKELIRHVYQTAWNDGRLPARHYNETVTARVIVRRDGWVIESFILRNSGQRALDASVQETLNVVRNIGRPFPPGVLESQQTFTIDFQMR